MSHSDSDSSSVSTAPSPSEIPARPNADDMDRLRRLDEMLKLLQSINPSMGIGQIRALVWAALAGDKGQQMDFSTKLGLSETAASGNLDYWTVYSKVKYKPRFPVLVKEQAIEHRSQNMIRKTPYGEKLIADVIALLRP